MDSLDTFAPPVDIMAEMGEQAPDVRIDVPKETQNETNEDPHEEARQASEEALPDEVKEPAPQKQVPLAALAESRRREKEAKAAFADLERRSQEQYSALERRLELLANPPQPETTFEDNPAEYLKRQTDNIAAQQKAITDENNQRQEAYQSQVRRDAAVQSISREMSRHEAEFRASTPDYDAAIAHLRTASENALEVNGVEDPQQRRNINHEQALQFAANALDKNQNPAELAYKLAKTYGYKVSVDATKQVKAMSEAQSRTQNMGSGKSDTPFNLNQLAGMDDAEFNAAIDNDANWSKIIRQT